MKKIFGCIFVICCLSSILTSCGIDREYEFYQPISCIERIEIISASQIVAASVEELKSIEPVHVIDKARWDTFFECFCEVPCFAYFTDPAQMIIGDAIRIIYQDGSYELICVYSGLHLPVNEKAYYPPYYFSSEEFSNLISDFVD